MTSPDPPVHGALFRKGLSFGFIAAGSGEDVSWSIDAWITGNPWQIPPGHRIIGTIGSAAWPSSKPSMAVSKTLSLANLETA